ncbi:YbaY family lipoprotein [Halomonas sp. 1390]|uniref:YbaY family lipoprotein n=1 Tax=Halomonas sp. B23F22_3 TaxID=3459516 RepID=UPI00373E3F77
MSMSNGIQSGIGGWVVGVCALLLAGCSAQMETGEEAMQRPDNALMQVITGEVWYRERIALPPGAEVVVTLEDQSRADAPATVITDYTHVVDDGQPPYSFRLVYDPSVIEERMRYGLRARIEKDGELLFTSTEHIDPFAGAPGEPVRIMVSRQ